MQQQQLLITAAATLNRARTAPTSLAPPLLLRERNVPEVESMYDLSFPKLSDRFFKQGPWPSVDAISDLVDQDHVFCLLYKARQRWCCCRLLCFLVS